MLKHIKHVKTRPNLPQGRQHACIENLSSALIDEADDMLARSLYLHKATTRLVLSAVLLIQYSQPYLGIRCRL